MTTARDIMTDGIEYLTTSETATDAARLLATADIGADQELPKPQVAEFLPTVSS